MGNFGWVWEGLRRNSVSRLSWFDLDGVDIVLFG